MSRLPFPVVGVIAIAVFLAVAVTYYVSPVGGTVLGVVSAAGCALFAVPPLRSYVLRRPDDPQGARQRGIVGAMCGGAALLGIAAGVAVWQTRVRGARHAAENICPLLEEYHRTKGRYPQEIDELDPPPRLPSMSAPDFYARAPDGRSYSLKLREETGFTLRYHRYDSSTATWTEIE